MPRLRNTETYRDRRRAASALLIAVVATLLDALSNKGSGWSPVHAFGFFLVLSAGPLVIVRIADVLFDEESSSS